MTLKFSTVMFFLATLFIFISVDNFVNECHHCQAYSEYCKMIKNEIN